MNKILVILVAFFATFIPMAVGQTVIELTETFIGLGIIPERNVSTARNIASQVPVFDRLVNMSVLSKVKAGESLTLGFVVQQGNAGKLFFVRAVGEGLKSFGVKDTLKDPVVKIYSGETLKFSNDDWVERLSFEEMRFYENLCGAFPLRKDNRLDSASLIYLSGGQHTVTVQGLESSDEGSVIVEIYEVPFSLVGKG